MATVRLPFGNAPALRPVGSSFGAFHQGGSRETAYEPRGMRTFPRDLAIAVRTPILRINRQYEPGLTPEQLYERTRRFWVMQPHDPTDVEFAITLAGDVLREVYRIDGWTRIAVDQIPPKPLRRLIQITAAAGPASDGISPVPSRAADVRDRLIGQPYRDRARNPVRWINC